MMVHTRDQNKDFKCHITGSKKTSRKNRDKIEFPKIDAYRGERN